MAKLTTRVGILRTGGGVLLAALLCILHPALALCDDLLVMPFTCAIISGRPVLTPSQNQGHRIIGAREQRSFRACSPANPALCREWTIHRFDIDCEGVALPWAAVAASARPDRAVYENGRLQVRMPPHWNLAADDPCASGERWRYGRLQRYCADRRALSQATVAMPPGFAPMLGIDAIFVTPSATRGTSPIAAHAPPLPGTPFAASVTRSEPNPAAAPKALENEPPPAKAPAVVAQAQPVAPTPGALPAPVVPRIINRTGAVPEPAPSLPPAVVAAAGPQVADASASPLTPVTPPAAHEARSPVVETSALTVTSLTPLAAQHIPAWTGFVMLAAVLVALTALVLTVLRTRRHRLRPKPAAARPPSFAMPTNQRVALAQAVARGPAAVWSTVAAPSPAWNEEVPRTRSDALRVLGMGVTADANLAAIKKIVDGLRQTWHPDLAHDNSDRQVREQRMKQINVAWDILAVKPART